MKTTAGSIVSKVNYDNAVLQKAAHMDEMRLNSRLIFGGILTLNSSRISFRPETWCWLSFCSILPQEILHITFCMVKW